MKRKFVLFLAVGASSVVLMSLNTTNSANVTPVTEVLATDWVVVGSPSTHFTPGSESLSVGFGSRATSSSSIAGGIQAHANREGSIALGFYSRSEGYYAVALGSDALAAGDSSVAMNMGKAEGAASLASGYVTAYGAYSTAIGDNLEAHGRNTTAVGAYNDIGQFDPLTHSEWALHPDGYAFVIGVLTTSS